MYDTKTNTFWLTGLHRAGVPLNLNGQESVDKVSIPSDVVAWIETTLHGAPASGTKTQTFGYKTAALTWSVVKE